MKKLIYLSLILLAACAGKPQIVEPTEPWIPGSDLYGAVRHVANLDSNRPCEEYVWQRYAPDGTRLIQCVRPVPGIDTTRWEMARHKDGRERELIEMRGADSARYTVDRIMTYDSTYHRLSSAVVRYQIRRGDEIQSLRLDVEYDYLQTDERGNWTRRRRTTRGANGVESSAIESREIIYW